MWGIEDRRQVSEAVRVYGFSHTLRQVIQLSYQHITHASVNFSLLEFADYSS